MNQPNAHKKTEAGNLGSFQNTRTNNSATPHLPQPAFIGAAGLIARLSRVKQTKPGHWVAASPCRDDRTPSLHIRELDDGAVLLHDFGGADYFEILAALGIEPIQLIPDHARHVQHRTGKTPPPLPCMDAMRAIAFQASVVLIAGHDIASGKTLGDVALRQLARAVQTIDSALRIVGVKV